MYPRRTRRAEFISFEAWSTLAGQKHPDHDELARALLRRFLF